MIEGCTEISDCEKKLFPHVRNVNLLSEIVLSPIEVNKLGALIKKEIYLDVKQGLEHIENKYPTCLACFLVWKGILNYRDGDYWSAIRKSLGISDPNIQNRLGDIFIEYLKTNSLMSFEIRISLKNITPILAHGIIPNSCLNEYFENILYPLYEELTYPENDNEIKFWLQNCRRNNTEINNNEEISDKMARYKSLTDIWDEYEKIKELERQGGDLNELRSLLEEHSNYYDKKQKKDNLEKEIVNFEDFLEHYKEKSNIFSEHDRIVLDHLDDISQCGNIIYEIESESKETNDLKSLNIIQDFDSIKKDCEEKSNLYDGTNSIELKNEDRINIIKNCAIALDINITDNLEQIVATMQNQLSVAKIHEESAIKSEQTINDIKSNLSNLRENLRSLEYEIQSIEQRFENQGEGDIQSGIEKIKHREKVMDDSCSIREALSQIYPDFDLIKNEKIWADLKQKNKETYISDFQRDFEPIREKINDFNKKNNLIQVPFPHVTESIRLFLINGGSFAEKFLIESVRMVKLTKEGKVSSLIVKKELPERIINGFREWWRKQHDCLFQWDEVPGIDSDKFKNFLIQNYEIDWILAANIEKIDENTIRLSKGTRSLLVRLNNENTRAILKFDDGTSEELNVKKEGGKLKLYESKLVIYFDDGLINVKFPHQYFSDFNIDASLIMNLDKTDFVQDLKIYKNGNIFETEDIDFSIDSPSESYKFQLKIGAGIKQLDVVHGIISTHPFMAFEYDSKKLIKKPELPRRSIWIISHKSFKFEPEIPIIEEKELTGEWNEYIAQVIDLKAIENLFICDKDGNKNKILIETKNQYIEPELYGIKLEQANSNGNNIFIGEAPRIRIQFANYNEIERWFIQIFPVNSDSLTESKHYRFDELSGIMHLDNQICEIPLSDDMCLGNAIGEFTVRVKFESQNVDTQLNFIVLPLLKLKFDKHIYTPYKDITLPVNLIIDCSKGLQFEPIKPAELTNHEVNTYFVSSNASEACINGYLTYNYISIPITIPIPRLTWQLKGIKIKKYIFETIEIGILSENEWNDALNEKISLIINLPSFVNGIALLRLNSSIGQNSREKIDDGKVIFDLRSFSDTLNVGHESIQPFKLSILDSKLLIKDILLFIVKKWHTAEIIKIADIKERRHGLIAEKWQITNIECRRISQGKQQLLEIKWNEIGEAKDKILTVWQLNEKPTLVYEEKLNSKCSLINIMISDKITTGRYYQIWITNDEDQDCSINKKIYLLSNWNYLKNIMALIKMQYEIITLLESRGDKVNNLKFIYDDICLKKNLYEKHYEKNDKLPSRNYRPDFIKLVIEFKIEVEKILKIRDNPEIRRILGIGPQQKNEVL